MRDEEAIQNKENPETVLPYRELRRFVEKLLKSRVQNRTDVEDISQNVFQRSWRWATRQDRRLSLDEWKRLIARISFNEINRFHTKRVEDLYEDVLPEDALAEIVEPALNPQFILEIAQELRLLPFRQRIAIVLSEGEILPYLKVLLSDAEIADLLEIGPELYREIEGRVPLTDAETAEFIERATSKPCRSSLRDDRCKGRKALKRRLFGR